MKNEESAGPKPSESQLSGQPPSLLEALSVLTRAMQEQTESINRLAASNEALVEAIADDYLGVDDLSPRHLDGSPVL